MYALLRLVQRLHHADNLLPAVDYILGLLQEVIKDLGLIELLKKLALEVLFGEVDQRVRNSLGYHVNHLALHDVEV